jgi:hypothetical protein
MSETLVNKNVCALIDLINLPGGVNGNDAGGNAHLVSQNQLFQIRGQSTRNE